MQLRPVQPKKKKKKNQRDSAPIHMSLTVQWGVTDPKQSDTPPHTEVLNSTPSPAENPPVTPQCVCACSVAQSCQTLCSPMNCSQPGSSVHGVLQARILEWVAIPFTRGSFQSRDRTRDFWIAGGFFTTDPPGKPRKSSLQCLSWQRPIKRLQKQWLHLQRRARSVADFSLSGCQTEVSAPCCLTMLGTKFCNIITCFHKTSEGESKTDSTTFFKAIIDVTLHTLCHI